MDKAFTLHGGTSMIGALLVACACSGTRAPEARAPAAQSRTAADSAATPRPVTDSDIQVAVIRRIEAAGALPAAAIQVSVDDRIVTLRGNVHRGQERLRAADVAEETRGVRAVVNLLQVNRTDVSDAELTQRLSDALKSESAEEFANVQVSVQGSQARLSGIVPRALAKELAEETAWFTGGVTSVDNQIQVVPGFTRPDEEVADAVRASLRSDAYLGQSRLQVVVEQGRVNLSGEVGSSFEKRRARRRALVAGVIDVNDVSVRVLPRSPGRTYAVSSPNPPSNAETTAAIIEAFRADPRVPHATIRVEAKSGIVTLTGTVATLAQKLAAVEDARSAAGVLAVDNRLQVSGVPGTGGLDIGERVAYRVRQSPLIASDRVHVQVRGGTVVLSGEVSSHFERDAAARAAAAEPGVLNIENRLTVAPYQKNFRSDAQLKMEIERNLQWDRRVGNTPVTVEVAHGVVTIQGVVPNPEVYDAILQNVFEARPLDVEIELRQPDAPRYAFR